MERSGIKRIQIIAALIAVFLIIILVKQMFFNPATEKFLRKEVREINNSCPIMIDEDTRLDSANVSPDDTIRYHYTMVKILKDSINIPRLESNLGTILKDSYKKNPELESYRKHQVTMVYIYCDKAGDFVTKITLSPVKAGLPKNGSSQK